MGSQTFAADQVFRQRASLRVAAVCAVTGVILLLSLAREWADYPRPDVASWVLLVLAVTWSVFVRPAVVLDVDGVTVRNVVRDVHIPWSRLTDVERRWSLKVYAGDRAYTAWAISSQVQRPRAHRGMTGLPGLRESAPQADSRKSAAAPKVNALTVAHSIEQAKREYDEAVSRGQLTESADDRVRVTWAPLVLAVVLLPAIAVIALSVA